MAQANVYIDGFNFYYGAMRDHPEHKWLNLESYFSTQLSPGMTLGRIRYFTAPVKPRPNDPDQPARQATYLSAIDTLPSVSIHKGQFQVTRKRVPLAADPRQWVKVVKVEEKGSDVNLATHLLLDAFAGDMDVGVVVTDDFDQIEPLKQVRQRFGLQLGIVSPRSRVKLSRAVGAAFYKPVKTADLANHQLPKTVAGAKGPLHRPHSWA